MHCVCFFKNRFSYPSGTPKPYILVASEKISILLKMRSPDKNNLQIRMYYSPQNNVFEMMAEENFQHECIVCLGDAPPTMIFSRCGHRGKCGQCAKRMLMQERVERTAGSRKSLEYNSAVKTKNIPCIVCRTMSQFIHFFQKSWSAVLGLTEVIG